MNQYVTGATIKRLREERALTQLELGNMVGVSDKTISKWETGRGLPDITLIEPLSEALGITVAELLSGQEIKNTNISGNMLRSKIYVCPICGNVIHSTGNIMVSCCGINLPVLEPEEADEAHTFSVEHIEDEMYVTINHPMSKDHYISFIAYVNGDNFEMKKLYPEGPAEARFKFRKKGILYSYCNKHGLNKFMLEVKEKWGNTNEYKEFEERSKNTTEEEMNQYGADFLKLFAELGALKDQDPASDEVQNKVAAIRTFITDHYYTCSKEVFKSLGLMYVEDERFKTNIDNAGGEGTAAFAKAAIDIYTA